MQEVIDEVIDEVIAILEKVLKPLDACETQCKLNLNPKKIRKALAKLHSIKVPEPKCKTCGDTGQKYILDKRYKSVEYAPPEAITNIPCPDCEAPGPTGKVIELLKKTNIRERADDIWAFQKEGNLSYDQQEAVKRYSCLLHDAAKVIEDALAKLREIKAPEIKCNTCGGSKEILMTCVECKEKKGRFCNIPNCPIVPCPTCKAPEPAEFTKRIYEKWSPAPKHTKDPRLTLGLIDLLQACGIIKQQSALETIHCDQIESQAKQIEELQTENKRINASWATENQLRENLLQENYQLQTQIAKLIEGSKTIDGR